MVIPYATELSALSTPFHLSVMGTLESVDQSAFSNVNFANCKAKSLTIYKKAQHATQTTTDDRLYIVAAANCKQKIDKI